MLLIALIALLATAEGTPETKQVSLKQGIVEGVKETVNDDRFFYSFRGIPYAAPPVGELRFKDPVPSNSWDEVRKNFSPPACPQVSMADALMGVVKAMGEEDCLYLHVYAPKDADNLPVMVYIHGGGFLLGDADNFGGTPRPLMNKDVVLLSIQYRLGTLGFLSTGDSVLPGNLGLKDQTFALRWVQDNIREFGGNPSMVTIFGESAGSGSCHYQIVTPHSEGLFHRAILQSGNILAPWALRDDHAERAISIAKSFNCPTSEELSPDTTQLLQCFKEKSVEELVLVATKDTVMNVPFYMVPRLDGNYLPFNPIQMLKEGNYNKVDVMSGICQNEMAALPQVIFGNETTKAAILDDFNYLAPILTGMSDQDNSVYLTRRALYHYGADFNATETGDKLEKCLSDVAVNIAHDEATALHARDNNFGKHTYRYELQHRGERSFGAMYNITFDFAKDWVAHGDDVMYMFDVVFGVPQVNRTDDVFLSNIIVDLWTNFARTGNPTPNLDLGFKWDPMRSVDDFRYLSLTPVPKMREDNRAEVREFWRNMPMKVSKILFPARFACSEDTC